MTEKKLKYLATQTIIGKAKEFTKDMKDGATKKLYRIYGLATLTRERPGKFENPSVEFRGQFQAVKLDSGEVFNSGRMYLPGEAADELASALTADSGKKGVKFGYEISVTIDKESDRGYFYGVESFMEAQENDTLNELAKLAGVKVEKKETAAPKSPKK